MIQASSSAKTGAVPVDRPWQWLAAGWRDLWAAPHVGFSIGAALTAAGWMMGAILLHLDRPWMILPLSAGFFLVAPLLAAGLYETSRRREAGEEISLTVALREGFGRNASQLGLMGVALLLLHLFWVRVAGLIFLLFFGMGGGMSMEALPLAMLRSEQFLPFLIVGTLAGAALAAAAFIITAFSIPMLVDKPELSVIEAIIRSGQAVLANPAASVFWAALIVVLTGLSLLPFFLGLALVWPLIGHATWHAYRDLIR